jgi:UDP-N-acetylglucosamine:LPS N-acetylglucosamine transferase
MVFHWSWVARLLGYVTRLADPRLLDCLTPETVAVVSTYPMSSQALGRLRRSGKLAVPAITYLCDPFVHRTWLDKGVDAHLALYPITGQHAISLGAREVHVVNAAVPPEFRPPRHRMEIAVARRKFQLPAEGKLALVVTGSLGFGDPLKTAKEIARTGEATPIVVCGRNEKLREHLEAAGIVALGWVTDMPTLMRACDVVIHNAGGLTCVEALASGLPVLTYRSIPGHGAMNSAMLDKAGTVPWARSRRGLAVALRKALAPTTTSVAQLIAPNPTTVISSLATPRIQSRSAKSA